MSRNSSDFSKHYIKLILEGNDPENFLDLCLRKGLIIRDVRWKSETVLIFRVDARSLKKAEELAGNRYKLKIAGHGGAWYRLKLLLGRKSLMAGLAVFAGLLFYQSLFISEISVEGYEAIDEQGLRKTMKEAGFYEGCRKNTDLNKVKLRLYEKYDNISWVGIKYDGNLARVTIAEGGEPYEPYEVKDDKPCNIVAEKEGYIDDVNPKEGMRVVNDGAFVKKGDVIISGVIPLVDSPYGLEEGAQTESYVHAEGSVTARIPVHLTFYRDAYEMKFKPTGRKAWSVSVNGYDIAAWKIAFKESTAKHIKILDIVKPFRIGLELVCYEEVKATREKVSNQQLKKELPDNIHKYIEENLPQDTQILNKSLNFSREKNIISIGVTLETLQQIGTEEEIIVDKSNRKSEKDGDQ